MAGISNSHLSNLCLQYDMSVRIFICQVVAIFPLLYNKTFVIQPVLLSILYILAPPNGRLIKIYGISESKLPLPATPS